MHPHVKWIPDRSVCCWIFRMSDAWQMVASAPFIQSPSISLLFISERDEREKRKLARPFFFSFPSFIILRLVCPSRHKSRDVFIFARHSSLKAAGKSYSAKVIFIFLLFYLHVNAVYSLKKKKVRTLEGGRKCKKERGSEKISTASYKIYTPDIHHPGEYVILSLSLRGVLLFIFTQKPSLIFSSFSPSSVQDCQVSEWGPWSACDNQCGAGSQSRTRHVVTEASRGGEIFHFVK